MDSLPQERHPSSSRVRLTADEREVIAVYNDADRTWRVYCDSATLRTAMLRLAQRIGAQVRPVGTYGIEFEAPGPALGLRAKRRGGGNPQNLARTRKSSREHAAGEGKVALLARL